MNTVDQLPRGRRALIAWVALTVLLLGLFVIVRLRASDRVTEQIDAAQERAVGHAGVIGGVVELKPDETNVSFNQRELLTYVQAEIFDDPTVARVRVYGTDGMLLFATDQDLRTLGAVRAPSEDPGVAAALAGTPYRSIVDADFTWSTVGAQGTTTELLQTFEPLRIVDRFTPVGVVETDFFMDDLRNAAVEASDRTLTAIAVLALLCLAAALYTFRRVSSAKAPVEETAPSDDVEADPEASAAALRTKLKTSEGRRAKAERALEETGAKLEKATAAAAAADERVKGLEADLAAATAAAAVAAATAPEPDPKAVEELERLRRELDEATTRTKGSEAAAETARTEVEAARAEAESARVAAETARTEVDAARTEAETARTEAETARTEAEAARTEAEAARTEAERAHADAEAARAEVAAAALPDGESGEPSATELLERLEERIVAAELRAKEAEERIDHLAPLSEEANDLRARLAKTAARKRLGPAGSED